MTARLGPSYCIMYMQDSLRSFSIGNKAAVWPISAQWRWSQVTMANQAINKKAGLTLLYPAFNAARPQPWEKHYWRHAGNIHQGKSCCFHVIPIIGICVWKARANSASRQPCLVTDKLVWRQRWRQRWQQRRVDHLVIHGEGGEEHWKQL